MRANGRLTAFLLKALKVSSTPPTPPEIGNLCSSNYGDPSVKGISNETTVLLLNDLLALDISSTWELLKCRFTSYNDISACQVFELEHMNFCGRGASSLKSFLLLCISSHGIWTVITGTDLNKWQWWCYWIYYLWPMSVFTSVNSKKPLKLKSGSFLAARRDGSALGLVGKKKEPKRMVFFPSLGEKHTATNRSQHTVSCFFSRAVAQKRVHSNWKSWKNKIWNKTLSIS